MQSWSGRRRGRRFLRVGGIAAWLLAGIPALLMLLDRYRFGNGTAVISPARFLLWSGAALIFLAAFWATSGAVGEAPRTTRYRALLALQTLAALFMFHFVCTGLETTLLVVVAVQLGLFVPLPAGLLWTLIQTALLAWLGVRHWGPAMSLGWTTLALPFEMLALFTSYYAASEGRARRALASTNAELLATRELLADNSRLAERMRIARELHDLVGHHLTALSLNLEVARHKIDGRAGDQIEHCQSLTKGLLADLREVVRTLREDKAIDLERVLRPLVEAIPHPRIHLDLPEACQVQDPQRGQALVRCVQEIITNAAKHAGGENVWIALVETADGLEVHAHDDGRGTAKFEAGHGLRGMSERLEELGGRLEVGSRPGSGFQVDAWIPLSGSTA